MNRKSIILIAVLTLVVLNIWRWWPASSPQSVAAGRTVGEFNIEDFEVKAIPVDSLPPLSRDIFHPKKVEVVKHRVTAPQSAVQSAPVKTPEETAKDNAQAEFAQIQCVGISVRNERVHAYLINAGEPSLVSSGDKVGSRFVVEKITTDGVTLRDPATGVGGLISVSGKR
jgi:hypothetical protein